MATAWSKLRLEASIEAPPLANKRTRSPSKPRITGRLALGPKPLVATPGKPSSVSPKVDARRSNKPSPANTLAAWLPTSRPSGLPVMKTAGASWAHAGATNEAAQSKRAAKANGRGK